MCGRRALKGRKKTCHWIRSAGSLLASTRVARATAYSNQSNERATTTILKVTEMIIMFTVQYVSTGREGREKNNNNWLIIRNRRPHPLQLFCLLFATRVHLFFSPFLLLCSCYWIRILVLNSRDTRNRLIDARSPVCVLSTTTTKKSAPTLYKVDNSSELLMAVLAKLNKDHPLLANLLTWFDFFLFPD